MFAGTNAQFFVTSSSQLQAVVPTGAVSGPITVITPIGKASSVQSFAVTKGEPFIASFTPQSGGPGTVVTIEGANFSGTKPSNSKT